MLRCSAPCSCLAGLRLPFFPRLSQFTIYNTRAAWVIASVYLGRLLSLPSTFSPGYPLRPSPPSTSVVAAPIRTG